MDKKRAPARRPLRIDVGEPTAHGMTDGTIVLRPEDYGYDRHYNECAEAHRRFGFPMPYDQDDESASLPLYAPKAFSALTQAERDKIPEEDFAGPDRTFYIRNQKDVEDAAHLIGKAADPAAVKARITAIAHRKGLTLPDAWQDSDAHDHAEAAPKADAAKPDKPADDADLEDDDDADDEEEHVHQQHDEPSVEGVHVDAPMGAQPAAAPRKRRGMSHYVRAFMGHVRRTMTTSDAMTPDQLADAMRDAHAHATRKGIAEAKARQAGEDAPADPQTEQAYADDNLNGDDAVNPLDRCDGCKNGSAACSCHACQEGDPARCACRGLDPAYQTSESAYLHSESGEPFSLYLPFGFAEAPEWINYLPRPGKYKHQKYGTIEITPAKNQHFVENFNRGVYQQGADGKPAVPIDAEHQSKVSGAMGWIHEMRQNGDGSADARVTWTDRGKTLLDDNRYKFFSPEFYESWHDPASGKKINHVAIGGALTTRPYFKSNAQGQSLRPLIASERGLEIPDDESPVLQAGESCPDGQEDHPMESIQLTEDQYAELLAFRERATAAEQDALQAVEDARRANERIGALERERERRIFSEEARSRKVPATDYISLMESLDEDQRDAVRAFVDPIIRQRNEGALFAEAGITARGQGSTMGQIEGLVQARRVANPTLSHAQAFAEVLDEQPELYAMSLAEAGSQSVDDDAA